MKKLMKKRLPLAILALLLVTSMILASTYAWFVKTTDILIGDDEKPIEASVKAAYFDINGDIPVVFNVDLKLEGISLYVDLFTEIGGVIDKDVWNNVLRKDNNAAVALLANPTIEKPGNNSTVLTLDLANIGKIYPGEGVRFTLDASSDSNNLDSLIFNNNRDIVVEVDLGELFKVLANNKHNFADFTVIIPNPEYDINDVTTDDIWFKIFDNEKEIDNKELENMDGKFYYLLKAGDQLDITDILKAIDNIVIEFGIIGHAYNQNHYMEKEFNLNKSNYELGSDSLTPIDDFNATITVVQATDQAVIDVFGLIGLDDSLIKVTP